MLPESGIMLFAIVEFAYAIIPQDTTYFGLKAQSRDRRRMKTKVQPINLSLPGKQPVNSVCMCECV